MVTASEAITKNRKTGKSAAPASIRQSPISHFVGTVNYGTLADSLEDDDGSSEEEETGGGTGGRKRKKRDHHSDSEEVGVSLER